MKVILLGPKGSSFVRNDIEILKSKYKVVVIDTNIGGGLKGMINLAKCTIKSMYHLLSSKAVISWFADYSTLVPVVFAKMLGKKSAVIAGGFDVGYIPELNYGSKARPFRWFCTKNSFLRTDLILPLSNWAEKALRSLIDLPKNKPVQPIYLGVQPDRFLLPKEESRDIFLTVSQGSSVIEYRRKGSDAFIAAAKNNPQYKFKLVGLRGEALEIALKDGKGIPNLEIIPGPLDLFKELIPLYQKTYAYLQLSYEETFGVAVPEAMSCGAVPIVSSGGALPEVSGKYAQIADNQDEIRKALDFAVGVSREYREELSQFAATYDIKFRGEKLLKAVDELIKRK